VGEADRAAYIFNLTDAALQEMISHCKKELPFEACGLLSGRKGISCTVWKMKNAERSPNSFSMNLNEIQQVFTQLEKMQQEFTGIYHSHPTDIAYPSPEDVLYNNYPDVVHIIISLASKKPIVKAFYIKGNKVIPCQINVTGN